MDILALLKELESIGASHIVVTGVALLIVRYWIVSANSELRNEITQKHQDSRDHTDAKITELRNEMLAGFSELRQTIADGDNALRLEIRAGDNALRQEIAAGDNALRQEIAAGDNALRQEIQAASAASEQRFAASEKRDREIILNLMDVRERLANVEGRLGMITYRQDIVPPPNLPQPENIEESPEREIVP